MKTLFSIYKFSKERFNDKINPFEQTVVLQWHNDVHVWEIVLSPYIKSEEELSNG